MLGKQTGPIHAQVENKISSGVELKMANHVEGKQEKTKKG